jgi:alanine racemase
MHTNSIIELNRTLPKISFLRDYLLEKSQNFIVVKGNAYGHGIKEIVSMAYEKESLIFGFDVEEAKAKKR